MYSDTLIETDPNKIAENIIIIINDINDNLCPNKKVKIQSYDDKIVKDVEINSLIEKRKQAYELMKSDKNDDTIHNYKNMKAETQRVIRSKRIKREVKDYNTADNDTNKLWKITKQKAFNNDHKPIEKIFHNNQLTVGSKKVCNVLNEFFSDKVKNTIDNMEDNGINPMKHFKEKIPKPKTYCNLKEVNYSNVKKVLTNMKSTNSVCVDNVSSKMIKKGSIALLPIILNFVNSIIKFKVFPKILKIQRLFHITRII